MRILLLTNSIGFGGVEKNVAFVANSLADKGHDVAILNFNSTGNYVNKVQQVFSENVVVYTYNATSSRFKHIKKIIFTLRSTQNFLPDIIVGFTAFPSYIAKLVSIIKGIPSVMTERGNPYETINVNNLKSRIELFFINKSAGGVFQTKGATAFYSEGLQQKSVIIPNPIYINTNITVKKFSKREKSVVSVGRLDNYQKRYDIMITAFALFSKRHSDWCLKLYGDGKDKAQIMQWCKDACISDKVKFMGVSEVPMEDICNSGIFLITSDYEGISNALLEAMAIGLPCVSTDSQPGGARFLIKDRENGRLVECRNVVNIADALCDYVDNPNFADFCGQNAREVVVRFDKDIIAQSWETYLLRIAKK